MILLLRLMRPADFRGEPEFQSRIREGRIPFRDHSVVAPRQGHGLGSVEDRAQRYPAELSEMLGQSTNQRLDDLVVHRRHGDPT